MRRQTFLQGAFILTVAGLVSKVLGALYRIPFARIVGEEGLGLYQMAYPLYTMILAISTTGIPIAVSILIADRAARHDRRGVERVFQVALALLTLVGLLSFFLLFAGAETLAAKVLKDPRAALALMGIAPALFFTSALGAFRGYFQGLQSMLPTAVSQVIEQVVRVITVLFAAQWLITRGIEYAAAGATFGATTGAIAALLCMVVLYLGTRWRRRETRQRAAGSSEPGFPLVGQILYLAVPISLEALVVPLMQTLDAVIVPDRLQAIGYTIQEATGIFGELAGMASTLTNLPLIFTISLATSLVPAVSEAWSGRNRFLVADRISAALRLTALICLPAALGLMALATPISGLLFADPDAGVPLFYLAPSILFIGLYQVSGAALQGLGRTTIPVVNMFFGAVLKIFCNYCLISIPSLGIKGAAAGTVAAFFLAAVLNFRALRLLLGYRARWFALLLKPVVAVTIMTVSVLKVYVSLTGFWPESVVPTLGGIVTGMAVYGLALVGLGEITGGELARVPFLGRRFTWLFPSWKNKGIR